jgi:subfamily B ATP-binding cassette protein HlyB/CyaB
MDRFHGLPVGEEDFVWVLGSLERLHGIPFDPVLTVQQFPPPFTCDSLLVAAQALGFNFRLDYTGPSRTAALELPCFAVLMQPEGGTPDRPSASRLQESNPDKPPTDDQVVSSRLVLITGLDESRIQYFDRTVTTPQTLPVTEFENLYDCRPIHFERPPEPICDVDAATQMRPAFGFSWFIPEMLKHRSLWRDVLLASLAIQLMALAVPLFTQIIIDKVLVHRTYSTLAVISVALAMFMLFTATLGWARQYLVLHTGNRIDAVLGMQVFEHLLKLPPRYFEHRPTGVVVTRLHAVETIREFIAGAAISLLLDLPFLTLFLVVMFIYSWKLSLIALGFLMLIVLASLGVIPALRRRLNQQFLLGARNQAFLTEYISGIETVKSLQMEPQLKSRFGDYLSAYLSASFSTRQLSNTYNTLANTLEQAMTLAVLVVGAWLVMETPGFTIGMLVAFQMFASKLAQPMMRIAGLWQEFQQAAIAVRRLADIMDAPAEPYSIIPVREIRSRGRIEIDHLGFRYGPSHPWLYRELSMTIDAGQCVAITGPSGCGKSTLAKLLQGFYLPAEGSIKLDGHDIRHLSANELRSSFGVVPQETTLFSGTLYDNIRLGNAQATFEDMVVACKAAGIHDTIDALPQGYQTQIGEHGAGLSGGQKQRIAIARALLKRPTILIFDEATSNLDEDTANAFGVTINALRGRVTILLIAHKLPSSIGRVKTFSLGIKRIVEGPT